MQYSKNEPVETGIVCKMMDLTSSTAFSLTRILRKLTWNPRYIFSSLTLSEKKPNISENYTLFIVIFLSASSWFLSVSKNFLRIPENFSTPPDFKTGNPGQNSKYP